MAMELTELLPSTIHFREELFRDQHVVLVRCFDEDNNTTVLVRAVKSEEGKEAQRSRVFEEQRIRGILQFIVSPYRTLEHNGYSLLVMDDCGGIPLLTWVTSKQRPILECLEVLIQTAEVLEDVHKAGVIHQLLSPETILWNPERRIVKLVDFSMSTDMESWSHDSTGQTDIPSLYLSPEQTGLVDYQIDHRTDLYSLGVSAWQMFVGSHPFAFSTRRELQYHHMATRPQPPHKHREDMPLVLSEILLKLMAKNPDERYQSAWGLAADLLHCKESLEVGETPHFALGQHDRLLRFGQTGKLYGRDAEQVLLRKVVVKAQAGEKAFIFVDGPPGVGKSSLVQGMADSVLRSHGNFASGRFEPLQGEMPYRAIRTALRHLLQKLMGEESDRLMYWKTRLQQALSEESRSVLVEFLPELQHLVDSDSSPSVLNPQEERFRTHKVFLDFLGALSSPQHPLVLFLDDLQWADGSSLEMIEFIASGQGLSGFVFVGTFRNSGHPTNFSTWFRAFPTQDASFTQLTLTNLTARYIQQMLVDLCDDSPEEIESLCELLVEKTAGNPFFVQMLLQQLYQDHLLWFEGQSWRWDKAAIRSLPVTDNVIALLVDSLDERPLSYLQALQRAACLGHDFQLQTLARLLGWTLKDTKQMLASQVAEGLILTRPSQSGDEDWYYFAHDRVKEAAYSMIPPDERASIHQHIAHLLAEEEREHDPQTLYDIVFHFQQATSLIVSDDERKRCAEFALQAGSLAHRSRAFESARQLLEWGLSILGSDRWEAHYDLTLNLACTVVEAGLACRERDWMEPWIQEVMKHGKTLVEQLPIWKAAVQSLISSDQMKQALDVANDFFARAGAPIIRRRPRVAVLPKVIQLLWQLRGKPASFVETIPHSEDPLYQAIIEVRALAMTAVFPVLPDQIPYLTLTHCLDSLEHGQAGRNITAWAGYGLFLANGLGDIQKGHEFAESAIDLLHKIGHPEYAPRTEAVTLIGIKAWLHPFDVLSSMAQDIYETSMNVGDLFTAFIAKGCEFSAGYQAGYSLVSLESLTHQTIQTSQLYQYTFTQRQLQLSLRAIQMLCNPKPPSLQEQSLGDKEQFRNATGEGGALLFQLHLYLVFGSWEQAFSIAIQKQPRMQTPETLLFRHSYWTYALVAIYHGIEKGWTSLYRSRKLRTVGQKQLELWVKQHPSSRSYRLLWVEAAQLRCGKYPFLALSKYDKAMEVAQQLGLHHDAALIAEHAATLCRSLEHSRMEQGFVALAIHSYQEWGAVAKVSLLKQRLLPLSERPNPTQIASGELAASVPSHVQVLSIDAARKHVDLQSVLQSAKALSHSRDKQVLLEQMMHLMLEHSLADYGLLLLKKYGEWEVAVLAEGRERDLQFPDLKVFMDGEESLFSTAMLRYIILTHETIALSNASLKGPFVQDPYVVRTQPRSVLCFPIVVQREIIGLVVLENRMMDGVFTDERLELLEVIATQAAMNLRLLQFSSSSELFSPPPSQGVLSPKHQTLHEPLLQLPHGGASVLTDSSSLKGKTVGDWTLLDLIAEGGMSKIWLAHNKYTDQKAALKMLLPEHQNQSISTQRFGREAQLLEQIHHPHIIQLLDFDFDPAIGPFMALEFLEGETLQSVLNRHAPVPLPWLLNILEQVCEALATIHKKQVLHRDLKPSNLFLTPSDPNPHVYLLDFGIAENFQTASDLRLTSTGVVVGTPSYLAPEQLKASGTLHTSTDLYALGVLLFEALTGRHPYGDCSSVELFVKVLQGEPTRLGTLRPEFEGSALELMISDLLTKDPNQRPHDAEQLFNELSVECMFLDDPLDSSDNYPNIQSHIHPSLK